MDEQNIPIDINNNKLLDWLVSRRHVNKDWQNSIIKVREKINNAIQDMPEHAEIIKLLSGQHINYFHCLKIIEILKETEADSKNLFGRYGSKRMKDWQEILNAYQKDSIYLAEAAQLLIRNVSYEIPSLKKQITKLEQLKASNEKKIKDLTKNEATALKEFKNACSELGIEGKNVKAELIDSISELPNIYAANSERIKQLKPTLDLYSEFNKFLTGGKTTDVLPLLSFVAEHGNVTTYEYTYGERPIRIDWDSEPNQSILDDIDDDNNAIDFGDGGEIDFGVETVDLGDNGQIDWGASRQQSVEEGFEIVEHVDVNFDESGIVVEKSGMDGGVAKGVDALTLLDNPKTKDQLLNDLVELQCFLRMRMLELSRDSDSLNLLQMQDVPSIIQMQTIETITMMNDKVNVVISNLTDKGNMQLHNIKHSPKFVDLLAANFKQKLTLIDRIKQNVSTLQEQIKSYNKEIKVTEPLVKLLIQKTKELQSNVQVEISKKYKGRVVNIVGGVNML